MSPLSALLALLLGAPVEHPGHPTIRYTLRVSANDTTAYEVSMLVRGVRDTFRIAMARHPEYDDRFWRFVEGLRAESPSGAAVVTREDSTVWRVETRGGEATLHWRVRPPEEGVPRASWRPFLSPTGALVGGPHSFPYVIGHEKASHHVTLDVPANWRVATALRTSGNANTFVASSALDLVESPILVGQLRDWRFDAGGIAHRVAYWPLPNAVVFDSARFLDGLARMSREAVSLFGRTPYKEYVFLVQDGAYGGLEHPTSVTLGAPSEQLSRNPYSTLGEAAHEFVHTWNLMTIRPVEYTKGITHLAPTPTPMLWFSEGLTMFYADLLVRRAGLPLDDSTRIDHLEDLIARYLDNPAYTRFSPESLSRVAYNAGPQALGDYTASVHLVGELIGAMLDLVIRDATEGRRSMDDVMRLLMNRFGSGTLGIATADVERAVSEICSCSVKTFFDRHVRGAEQMDLPRMLSLAGLQLVLHREPVTRNGAPDADYRVWAWVSPADSALRLRLVDPASVWGRAGLHTGERVTRINDTEVRSWPDFRTAVLRLRVGDTVRVEIEDVAVAGLKTTREVTFRMEGYERTRAQVQPLSQLAARQRQVRAGWLR
jgi:predicted metalloprotease with PDZ domain